MHRLLIVALAALGLTVCSFCAWAVPQPGWTTGFWFSRESSARVAASAPLDVLYVETGSIQRSYPMERKQWAVYRESSDVLPPARQYWLVYRMEEPAPPPVAVLPDLRERISDELSLWRRRKLAVAGVHLDIRSPAGKLAEYSEFIRLLRAGLPAGVRLSITAPLDWFRPGTSVAEVLKHTDEFVPWFYDIADRNARDVIAVPIDAKKWGEVFESLGKTYRIGASSLGRARYVQVQTSSTALGFSAGPELSPLDLGRLPGIRRTATPVQTGELRLVYELTRPLTVRWSTFVPGDQFEFTLPTTNSIRAAVEAARVMGSHCAGVVFFRWPAATETLPAEPDQALRAAGVLEGKASLRLIEQDKGCAAVSCTDLFLADVEPISSEPLRYLIRSSVPLEYFLPSEKAVASMIGPEMIEVSFPPFPGRSRMYLGTAVTGERSEYRIGKAAQ